MKLLQPAQVKDLKSQEVVKQILRAKEVEEIVNKNNLKLAKSEMDFNMALARYRTAWEEEEREHKEAVKIREKEIEELELKRQKALTPIQLEVQRNNELIKETKLKWQEVKEKEQKVEEIIELLQDKLDIVSERETIVEKIEKEQENKQKSINIQNDMSKRGAELLTKQIADFKLKQSIAEQNLASKEKDLRIIEINLDAKAEKNKRDIEAIEKERIRLNDMRATLERAMRRL